MTPVIYITGGGKCGTHIVARYLEQCWENSTRCEREFQDWREELPGQLENTSRYIFHCPSPDIPRFRQIAPAGKALILLRHPVQHYVSRVAGLFNRVKALNSFDDPSLDENILKLSFRWVIEAFNASSDADAVWRLEDFTSSWESRQSLVGPLLEIDNAKVIDSPVSTGKSAFGWSGGIVQVTGSEYPSILTDPEIRAFELHNDVLKKYYPDWKSSLVLRELSNEDRLRARSEFSLGLLSKKLRRKAVQNLQRGQLSSIPKILQLLRNSPSQEFNLINLKSAEFSLCEDTEHFSSSFSNKS